MKVLITTSGIGQRLGDLTKYTNKSLVRIGKKPSISYIVESYPEDTEYVITLGYFGDQVKDFLTIAYPNRSFTFVNVDKYEGVGSSLLYSMLCAKDYLQEPFIFHACDTILENESIAELDHNWLGCYTKTNTSHYRTVNVENNVVIKLNEKGEISYDFEYIGVCGIRDFNVFWCLAEDIYKKDSNNNSLSDCDVIRKMLNNKFNCFVFNNWLDIGNIGALKEARNLISDKFEILDKLDESIFMIDNSVIKFFYNSSIVENRVNRSKQLKDLVPEVIDSKPNFYKYNYIEGSLFAHSVNEIKFKSFLEWSKNKLWQQILPDENFFDLCYDFYFNKTESRIKKFFNENNILDRKQNINGYDVPELNTLLNKIDWKWLCGGVPVRFHGDFILDNIIETKEGFCLLDWRQDFAGKIEYGDIYYDLSKLNHNLVINHDIINDNLFRINMHNDNNVECDILRPHRLVLCQETFNNFLIENNFDIKKVKILTALIWLNMAPLHHYPFNIFLFYFGKYHLYKAIMECND